MGSKTEHSQMMPAELIGASHITKYACQSYQSFDGQSPCLGKLEAIHVLGHSEWLSDMFACLISKN